MTEFVLVCFHVCVCMFVFVKLFLKLSTFVLYVYILFPRVPPTLLFCPSSLLIYMNTPRFTTQLACIPLIKIIYYAM